MINKQYVLISPVRNEEAFVEKTLTSVLSQTVLPTRWIVVNDGSTDRTDEIVERYARSNSLIQPVRAEEKNERSFGSKVKAFKAGYEELGDMKYSFIGNLDADVSFDPEYFEQVLKRFEENAELGIGGGIIQELIDGEYVTQTISLNSVAGAVQLFRRHCYEEIGGYIPIKEGGIDAAAEIMARMRGWKTQTFPELKVLHHRRVATGGENILATRFRKGQTNFLLGYHPLFQLLSCLYRIKQRPYLLGSLLTLSGFLWSVLTRRPRELPDEVIAYLRGEQMRRIGLGFLEGSRLSPHKLG